MSVKNNFLIETINFQLNFLQKSGRGRLRRVVSVLLSTDAKSLRKLNFSDTYFIWPRMKYAYVSK